MIYYAITVYYLILYCIILSYIMLYYCAREEAQGGRGSPPLPLPSLPRHNNPAISGIMFVFSVYSSPLARRNFRGSAGASGESSFS